MEKHTKLFVGMTVSLALVLFGLIIIGLNAVQEPQQQQEPTTPEETETEEPCEPTG